MKSRTLMCVSAITLIAALALPVRLGAQVTGSGTTNFIPRWTGSTTLGNSILFQSGGKVGIGTSSPAATLDSGLARAGTIISFDAPGAGTGPAQGTFSLSINSAGTITGNYIDAKNVFHGFVRTADGTITSFDAPDAGTSSFQGTLPVAISLTGVITGSYADASSLTHGFVRAINGTITPFDAPGAGPFGTLPSSISPEDVVTGTFADANFVTHGFLRAPNGAIAVFDDPNGGTSFFEGTAAVSLDPQGAIVGCYTDSNFATFGFLRVRGGTFTTLNPPGGLGAIPFCSSIFSVLPSMAINSQGIATGEYFQPVEGNPFGGNFRGFVRALDGNFTTFDAVSSPSSPCCTWTFPISINPAGEIVGFDNDFHNVNHGFLRATNGAITLFDAPGAHGTVGASINPAGVVTGYFFANSVAHGFLLAP
jgi:predicted membrane protein